MYTSVFLPVKARSTRLNNKNFMKFLGNQSLLQLKTRQILACGLIDELVISTDAREAVLTQLDQIDDHRLRIEERGSHLCRDDTSIEALSTHAGEITSYQQVIWTHVTSPLFSEESYVNHITAYRALQSSYDSAVSVRSYHDFVLFRDKPLNFDEPRNRWPRTQDLEPISIINNAFFLTDRNLLLEGRRLGETPMLIEAGLRESVDIDTEEDFYLARSLAISSTSRSSK